jgi:hypothetical protein
MKTIHWVEEGSNEEEKRKQIEAELRAKLEAEARQQTETRAAAAQFDSARTEVSAGNADVVVKEISSINWLSTLLFCVFLGWCAVHRFYTRRIISGALMLLLSIAILTVPVVAAAGQVSGVVVAVTPFGFIGWFLWWVIDVAMIVTGKFTDKSGKIIVRRKKSGKAIQPENEAVPPDKARLAGK